MQIRCSVIAQSIGPGALGPQIPPARQDFVRRVVGVVDPPRRPIAFMVLNGSAPPRAEALTLLFLDLDALSPRPVRSTITRGCFAAGLLHRLLHLVALNRRTRLP